MKTSNFAELIARVKDKLAREQLQQLVATEAPVEVDLASLGLDEDGKHPETVAILQEIGAGLSPLEKLKLKLAAKQQKKVIQDDTATGNLASTMCDGGSLDRNSVRTSNSLSDNQLVGLAAKQQGAQQNEQTTSQRDSEQQAARGLGSIKENDETLSKLDNQTLQNLASPIPTPSSLPSNSATIGVAKDIQLNSKQQQFNDLVLSGASCVLIGAAGTGKTTSMRTVTRSLLDAKKLGTLKHGTKWLKVGTPGAAILSFTNKAVNNIRHAVVDELKSNTITAHKLLEFQPQFEDIPDPEKPGHFRKTMRFVPTRDAMNPLPPDLQLLAWEESSMIGVPLYNLVQAAMQHKHQEIFLGDIQQLPPVFGLAVLGFKMLELPVVELTDIYRQAADSPIISLAHALLAGDAAAFSSKTQERKVKHSLSGKLVTQIFSPALEAFSRKTPNGEVIFQPFQKTLEPETALNAFCVTARKWIAEDYYNPEKDIILCPFNVSFGTVEINKKISQYLGVQRGATVWEVIAGYNKHYLAVGDRVMYDKEDAVITSIAHNGAYLGPRAQLAATTLDRWGHHQEQLSAEQVAAAEKSAEDREEDAFENYFLNLGGEDEDRVHAASHVITVQLRYSTGEDGEPEEIVLDTAAAINSLLGGYAITVHKFQGSEEENVFLVLHKSHAVSINRELLYTAVTRAKKRLHIVCEFTTFEKGIATQRIKGDTLAEKADWFKGKRAPTTSTGEEEKGK